MKRRTALLLGGSLLVTGCSGLNQPGSSNQSGTPALTQSRANGSQTPALGIRAQYPLEAWHELDHWQVTVEALELTSTVRLDEGETTYEMPEDRQLAIATAKVKNTTESRRGWAGRFGVIVDEEAVYESQLEFEHPEFSNRIDIRQLRQVDHQRQFSPSALPVESGQTERAWVVTVLPSSVSRNRLAIGLETLPNDVYYPIRWSS